MKQIIASLISISILFPSSAGALAPYGLNESAGGKELLTSAMKESEVPKPFFEKGCVICWDIDGTLRGDQYSYPEDAPIEMREGIEKCLKYLSSKGARHAVTTSRRYPDSQKTDEYGYKSKYEPYEFQPSVFKSDEAGLLNREYFELFYSNYTRGEVNDHGGCIWGKNYSIVAHKLDIPSEDITKRMIVIGDAPGDTPLEEGLIFIKVPAVAPRMNIPAEYISNIIDLLYVMGAGDFGKGFDKLLNAATNKESSEYGEQGTYIEEGKFELQLYVQKDRGSKTISLNINTQEHYAAKNPDPVSCAESPIDSAL